MKYDRTRLLIGNEAFEKLQSKNIIIFGVGGVGGYVCEMLARSGIRRITIVDYDSVTITNFNRQIIALDSNINQSKVSAFKQRLLLIDDSIDITTINEKLTIDNIKEFQLESYDFVIDCIDDVRAKFQLISYCKQFNIELIVALGAGNRYDIPSFEIVDITQTSNDGLARRLRKLCKDNDICNVPVVFSRSKPMKFEHTIGSIAYYPVACASVLSAYVINKIIN